LSCNAPKEDAIPLRLQDSQGNELTVTAFHEVRRLKRDASADTSVGGATLAAEASLAGLVDEIRVFIAPAAVGGGLKMFPDGVALRLEPMEDRSFGNGMTFVRYSVRA
jgi:riboflavin biosynthesis pyrimidine reductase